MIVQPYLEASLDRVNCHHCGQLFTKKYILDLIVFRFFPKVGYSPN